MMRTLAAVAFVLMSHALVASAVVLPPTNTLCTDLQNAIDGHTDNSSLTVYLQSGAYSDTTANCGSHTTEESVVLVTSSNYPVSIVGAGSGNTNVEISGGGWFVGTGVGSTATGNVTLKGFTFRAKGRFYHQDGGDEVDTHFSDLIVLGSLTTSVHIDAATSTTVSHCTFADVYVAAESTAGVFALLSTAHWLSVSDSTIQNCTGVDLSSALYSLSAVVDVRRTRVVDSCEGDRLRGAGVYVGGGAGIAAFDSCTFSCASSSPEDTYFMTFDVEVLSISNSNFTDFEFIGQGGGMLRLDDGHTSVFVAQTTFTRMGGVMAIMFDMPSSLVATQLTFVDVSIFDINLGSNDNSFMSWHVPVAGSAATFTNVNVSSFNMFPSNTYEGAEIEFEKLTLSNFSISDWYLEPAAVSVDIATEDLSVSHVSFHNVVTTQALVLVRSLAPSCQASVSHLLMDGVATGNADLLAWLGGGWIVELSNSTFVRCSALGSAIDAYSIASLSLTRVSVVDTACNEPYVEARETAFTVRGCNFAGNTASGIEAIVKAHAANVHDTQFVGNVGETVVAATDVVFTNNSVVNNTGSYIAIDVASAVVSDFTFSGNERGGFDMIVAVGGITLEGNNTFENNPIGIVMVAFSVYVNGPTVFRNNEIGIYASIELNVAPPLTADGSRLLHFVDQTSYSIILDSGVPIEYVLFEITADFTKVDAEIECNAACNIAASEFRGTFAHALRGLGFVTVDNVLIDTATSQICESGCQTLHLNNVVVTGGHGGFANGVDDGRVTNCSFTGGTATLFSVSGALEMEDTVIVDSTSNSDAMVAFDATATSGVISNCSFARLQAGTGSAISVDSGYVVVRAVRVTDCYATSTGGAFYATGGSLQTENTTVRDCSAQFSGGAAELTGGTVTFGPGTLITGNSAPIGGGVSADTSAVVNFNGASVTHNSASTSGAGLDCHGGSTCNLVDSTLSFNAGPAGGGAFVQFSTLTVDGSSVVDNAGTVAGSGLCCFTSATCTVVNSAIRRNTGAAGLEVLIGGSMEITSSIVADHEVGLSAFAGDSVSVNDTAFTGHSGRAIDCSGTVMALEDVIVRDNSGSEAIYVSGVDSGVSMRGLFVAANAGTAIGCDTATFSLTDSIVCDNGAGVECDDSCSITSDGGSDGCAANNTECASTCVAVDYCVPPTGFYSGPYDGCFECGGACDAGAYVCTTNAVCIDVPPSDGPYSCACATGYTGDGYTLCTDVDECALDPCSPDAVCANTAGSFTCTCKSGYSGDGYDCVDIDECAEASHTCSANATCINVPGGFSCGCDTNFYGSGSDCVACPANSGAAAGTAFNASDCGCDFTFYRLGGEDSPCEQCPAGYRRFLVPDACVQCGKGSYSTTPNSLSCTACPADMTTQTGSAATSIDDCKCGVGYVKSGDGQSCVSACVPGTYINPDGGCADCPPASYTNATNALACTSCPPYTQTTAAIGNVDIRNCSCLDQFYRSIPGDPTSGCLRFCPAGSSRPADDSCAVCGIGSYTDVPNAAECIECPTNAVSKSNSTAVTDCRCPSGYFSEDRKYGTECKVCPDGAKCRGGRSPPEALPNYYPVDGGSGFVECTPASACAGGGECSDGYTGNLCAACDTGYYRLDGLCRPCSSSPALVLTLFFFVLLVFCAGLTWFNTKERALNWFVSVVIGVNSLQVIAMYGRLELEWPEIAQKFFDALSIFNFNIELFAPECASPGVSAFWLRWTLTMFIPVMAAVVFGLILAVCVALIKAGAVAAWSEFTPTYMGWTVLRAFFQLMSFVYLPLTAAVFEYFDCVVDGSGVTVIAGARDTLCYDSTYWSFAVVAFFGLLAYPIGVPSAAGALLWRGHNSMSELRFELKFGFLVARYSPDYYYYELAVMARKLTVALVFSFVFTNPYVKAGFGLAALLVFYSFQLGLQPYRHSLYNEMEMVSLGCAMLVLLFTVTFQAIDVVPGARDVGIVTALCFNLVVIVVGVGLDIRRQVTDTDAARADASGVFASSIASGGTEDEFNGVKGVQLEFVAGTATVSLDDGSDGVLSGVGGNGHGDKSLFQENAAFGATMSAVGPQDIESATGGDDTAVMTASTVATMSVAPTEMAASSLYDEDATAMATFDDDATATIGPSVRSDNY